MLFQQFEGCMVKCMHLTLEVLCVFIDSLSDMVFTVNV